MNFADSIIEPDRISTYAAIRRPPAIKLIMAVKNCDDDDNIRTQYDHTLISRIVMQGCPCKKRFKNNQTRFALVSDIFCRQVQTHLQTL